MKCNKCNFLVPANMRFCLMKNMCPSCGSPLFSNTDANHISMLQNRISAQSFGKEIDEVQRYDLALFIFNEIREGYGKTILDEEVKKIAESLSSDKEAGVLYNHEEAEPEDGEPVNPENIRKEIEEELREEIMANLNSDEGIEMGTLYQDEDERINRLKAQAVKFNGKPRGATSPISNSTKILTGASVRRVG
jgi:hypothetical protein